MFLNICTKFARDELAVGDENNEEKVLAYFIATSLKKDINT